MIVLGFKRRRRAAALPTGPLIELASVPPLESAPVGTVIGTLSVARGSGSYDYTLSAHNGRVQIVGNEVRTAVALDYEAPSGRSLSFTVTANNGAGSVLTRAFAVSVRDVVEAPPPPPPPPGTTTLDTSLAPPFWAYVGNDAQGRPQFDYGRLYNTQVGWKIELETAPLPDYVGSQKETQAIAGAAVAEGGPLGFALLATMAYIYTRIRYVVGDKHSPWSRTDTNDRREPIITNGGTAASPETTTAQEGASYGPVLQANKPGRWRLDAAGVVLFGEPPATLTQTLDLADFITDFEAVQSYLFAATIEDARGQVSPPRYYQHLVTNNPADDPMTSGIDPALSDDAHLAFSSGNRIITRDVASGPSEAIGALARSSGLYGWELIFPDEPGDGGVGFKDTNSGVTAFWYGGGGANYADGGIPGFAFGAPGDRIFVVRDAERNLGFVRKNGVWTATGDPATGPGKTLPTGIVNARPAILVVTAVGYTLTYNTGQLPPLGGVPANVLMWG